MHRNGLNIFLYTSDQPLDTVLFFTTTQQKLFWSSRFTGAHYNYCRSTGSTLEADTKGRLLYNFIRRGHSVHSDSWGQAKTNWVYHSLLWNRTKERKKETEIVLYSMPSRYWALKDGYCAPLRRHPCGFITAQRWLLLMASVSQIFGEMWNGTTQTSDRITPRSSSLPWCKLSSARLVWRFLHYRNPNLLPQHKSLWNSNRWMPAHVTLSQASKPALFNRAAPVGPVPNLSKSVFQQIIGSKGREVSLLFLPVCLNLCSIFSYLPSLIPYLFKYAVYPKKNLLNSTQKPRPFSLWDKAGQKRMNVKQAVMESEKLRKYKTSALELRILLERKKRRGLKKETLTAIIDMGANCERWLWRR